LVALKKVYRGAASNSLVIPRLIPAVAEKNSRPPHGRPLPRSSLPCFSSAKGQAGTYYFQTCLFFADCGFLLILLSLNERKIVK
jgi:hypothetical protein